MRPGQIAMEPAPPGATIAEEKQRGRAVAGRTRTSRARQKKDVPRPA